MRIAPINVLKLILSGGQYEKYEHLLDAYSEPARSIADRLDALRGAGPRRLVRAVRRIEGDSGEFFRSHKASFGWFVALMIDRQLVGEEEGARAIAASMTVSDQDEREAKRGLVGGALNVLLLRRDYGRNLHFCGRFLTARPLDQFRLPRHIAIAQESTEVICDLGERLLRAAGGRRGRLQAVSTFHEDRKEFLESNGLELEGFLHVLMQLGYLDLQSLKGALTAEKVRKWRDERVKRARTAGAALNRLLFRHDWRRAERDTFSETYFYWFDDTEERIAQLRRLAGLPEVPPEDRKGARMGLVPKERKEENEA